MESLNIFRINRKPRPLTANPAVAVPGKGPSVSNTIPSTVKSITSSFGKL